MVDPGSLILSFFIILFASLVQGATAFGFALVSVPLMLLFMPTVEVVTLSLFLATPLNIFMIRDERQEIAWREVAMLLPGAAMGAVAGMLFLKNFDGPLFKSFAAAAFLIMALTMLAGRAWQAGPSQILRQAVSFISGVLMGSTSMGGPPVVLYLTGRGLSKCSLRGTLALFFLIGNLFALAAFLAGGLFGTYPTFHFLILAAALLPGYLVGRRLTHRLSSPAFRRLVLISMAVIACAEVLLYGFS